MMTLSTNAIQSDFGPVTLVIDHDARTGEIWTDPAADRQAPEFQENWKAAMAQLDGLEVRHTGDFDRDGLEVTEFKF